MADDVKISIGANTENFKVGIEKAFKTINEFGTKNRDLAAQIDKAYKQLSADAARMSDSVQGSFNSLQIKSDASMEALSATLKKNSKAWVDSFDKIVRSADTTSNDIERAFRKLGELNAVADASGLKSEFQSLGIQSTASIEAMKLKIVNAFEEIKLTGTKYPQDIVRAQEAMTLEIERLDKMLMTSAERAATVRATAFKESAAAERASYAAQGMSGNGAAAGLIGQPLAGADFGNRLKAQMEEASALAQTRSREMASYAASAMQGEAAAARLVGQTQAGAGFAAQLKSQMEGVSEHTAKATHGMSGFSLASIAAIAKVQIMYSIINSIMSGIASIPKMAIDAIETFNASVVKNAATITSMSGDTKDIGKAYRENKVYAEAVQNVLVKMDAESIASYKQLQLMNDAFVQQGVFIDINNQKQVQGYKNIANALATMSAGMQNPDMQFSQEVRGLMNAEDKPTNQLFRTLKAIDPELKNHILQWKQIAAETGNAGYVLEKLGPLLVGYAAASGDIDSLWTTIKSTLGTIRDDILRGGLKEGFTEIVNGMKEIAKYAEENKDKIQAFLQDGFQDAKKAAKFIWDIRDGFKLLSEAALYVGAAAGIASITTKLIEMYKVIAAGEIAAKGGLLLKTLTNPVAMATLAVILGGGATVKKASENSRLQAEAEDVKRIAISMTDVWNREAMKRKLAPLNASHMAEFYKQNPLGDASQAAMYFLKGGANLVPNRLSGGSDMYSLQLDKARMDFILANQQEAIKPPKAPKGGGEKGVATRDNENAIDNAYNAYSKAFDEREAEAKMSANKRLLEINEQGYTDGKVQLQNYLITREQLIEANLKFEIDAKKSELASAKALDANKIISRTDAKGKTTVDYDAMYVQHLNALKGIEDAKKALAVAEDKLNEAKAKGIKFDEDFKNKELLGMNSLLGMIAKANSKSEKSPLERQLEGIANAADDALVAYSKWTAFQRLEGIKKGISSEADVKVPFNAEAMRVISDSMTQANEAADKMKLSMNRSIKGLGSNSLIDKYKEEQAAVEQAADDKLKTRQNEIAKMGKLDADEMIDRQKKLDLMTKAQEEHDKAVAKSKELTAELGLSSLSNSLGKTGALLMKGNKEQFEAGKKFAIASAGISTALGAINAFTSMAKFGTVGMVLGGIAAAAVIAEGAVAVAQIGSQTYQGREFGGPVVAGQSYIVGEKRPELFTPGASGVITPYVPNRDNQGGSFTQVNNFSTGVADTVRSEMSRMMPVFAQLAVSAVKQAQYNGEMQAA